MLLRRGTTLATMFAVLLVAGCTAQEPEPDPPAVSQSPSATAEPPQESPSPTPTEAPVAAPAPPAELERTDEVGAAAAAEYFLELYGYVMQTGDVAAWEAMSWETCGFCSQTSELAKSIAASRQTFSGGEMNATETFVHEFDDLVGGYPVDVTFSQTEATHRDEAGEVIQAFQPDNGTFGVDLLLIDGRWQVASVTAQDL